MTREEKQKAIGVLKISVPFRAVTQEEFIDYNKTLHTILDWLEQEPCDDCISRQAVLEGVDTYINKAQSTGTKDDFYSFAELVVKALPPVTPQPKTAYWLPYAERDGKTVEWVCSSCRRIKSATSDRTEYCPVCRAKMIESQESEDKR